MGFKRHKIPFFVGEDTDVEQEVKKRNFPFITVSYIEEINSDHSQTSKMRCFVRTAKIFNYTTNYFFRNFHFKNQLASVVRCY